MELSALNSVCAQLEELSPALETEGAWPEAQFGLFAESDVLGWVIPSAFGGGEIKDADLLVGYERLSRSCLVTTFVLTQRNGACQRIAGSDNDQLKAELLPQLCRGDLFATVGISHLTTSRQHKKTPAVLAEPTSEGYRLSGLIPWVTGAGFADLIVTGGTCPDGRQLLLALPTNHPGVSVQPPPKLLALNASQTASVQLDEVELSHESVLRGPIEQVMKQGNGTGAGGLTTSALANGHARGALIKLEKEAEKRPDLLESYAPLDQECAAVSQTLLDHCRGEAETVTAEEIRHRANSLCLRSTQALLAASKGAGFVSGHPAERAVREAMFFLVWSCPQPVLQATLREFACLLDS